MRVSAAAAAAAHALGYYDSEELAVQQRHNEVEEGTMVYHVLFAPGSSRRRIESVALDAHDRVNIAYRGYVWQQGRFKLQVVENDNGVHLRGSTRIGDSVHDEWFITWLLAEITRVEADAVVHVVDGDGDFLAIEAARDLPAWMAPETTSRRIYIHRTTVHIIPPILSPPRKNTSVPLHNGRVNSLAALQDVPNVHIGAAHVRTYEVETRADSSFQRHIDARLLIFPAAAATSQHVARVLMPISAALLLTARPRSVSAAAAAFLARDAEEARVAARMRALPPSPLVAMSIPMTRLSFARLLATRYEPQRAVLMQNTAVHGSGVAVVAEPTGKLEMGSPITSFDDALDVIGHTTWGAPTVAPPCDRDDASWIALTLGCKLTAGLEILLWCRSRGVGQRFDDNIAAGRRLIETRIARATGNPRPAPPAGAGLRRYLSALAAHGYFDRATTAQEAVHMHEVARDYYKSSIRDNAAMPSQSTSNQHGTQGSSSMLREGDDGSSDDGDGDELPDRLATALIDAEDALESRGRGGLDKLSFRWPPLSSRDDSVAWLDEHDDTATSVEEAGGRAIAGLLDEMMRDAERETGDAACEAPVAAAKSDSATQASAAPAWYDTARTAPTVSVTEDLETEISGDRLTALLSTMSRFMESNSGMDGVDSAKLTEPTQASTRNDGDSDDSTAGGDAQSDASGTDSDGDDTPPPRAFDVATVLHLIRCIFDGRQADRATSCDATTAGDFEISEFMSAEPIILATPVNDIGATSNARPRLVDYMQAMDAQLRGPLLTSALLDVNADGVVASNLAESLYESIAGQAGTAGPASTMLSEMGIRVPASWWHGDASRNGTAEDLGE